MIKRKFYFILLILTACIQHQTPITTGDDFFYEKTSVDIRYAKGFQIIDQDSVSIVKVNSLQSVYQFSDSLIIPHQANLKIKGKSLTKKIENIACQSTTYIPFLNILDKGNTIKAACGLSYISDSILIQQLNKDEVVDICLEGKIQLESIYKINPDLFFIYPFELENSKKYEENGIFSFLVAEYLEETALARLEWIKLFGFLMNENKKAKDYFDEVEAIYLSNVIPHEEKNTVFFNLPFKDLWDMPSSNSITANLAKDAGLSYIYSNHTIDNLTLSKEKVWNDVMNTNYWIIIANRPQNFSLNDLLEEEKIYAEFESVKNKHVIFCNTAFSEYFTNGIVEPHIMLLDLHYCTGKIKNHTPKYFKILE